MLVHQQTAVQFPFLNFATFVSLQSRSEWPWRVLNARLSLCCLHNRAFFGTWSNYPYYKSGVVAIHSIERGLFLVKPNLPGLGPLAPAIDNLKTQPPRGGPGHGSWPSRGRGRGRGRGRRD